MTKVLLTQGLRSEVCLCINNYSSTHNILFQLHMDFVNQLKGGRHSSYEEVIISHLLPVP